MVANQELLEEAEKPARPLWRRWKWIGLALFLIAILFRTWLPGIVVAIGYVYGIVVIANLLFHLGRYLRDRLFWRVRNRLIASFVFVGLIPILVLMGLMFLSAYLLLGQMAATYFSSAIKEVQGEVAKVNGELAGSLPPNVTPASFAPLAARVLGSHAELFPRAAARLLKSGADRSFQVISAFDPAKVVKPEAQVPAQLWLAGSHDFDGILSEDRNILIMSLKPVLQDPGYYLEVTVPFDNALEQKLAREKSLYLMVLGPGRTEVKVSGAAVQVNIDEKDQGGRLQAQAEAEQKAVEMEKISSGDPRRMITFGTLLEGTKYATGEKDNVAFVFLKVPLAILFKNYLSPSDLQGRVILNLIYIFAGLFVFAEIASLVIGLTISRRVTRSVHEMYQGTMALQGGDLQYRIPVRRKDQLGLLAHSFNQMSASITRLLEEVSEKKRLEQELEIAREVQATLFPKKLPHPRGMTVFGGCEPARTVSGDYYDFIVEDEARLHIVVGDISGKGISAALLMANLQAAMRSQLLALKSSDEGGVEKSLAEVMAQLNQQIYLNSPTEKYATLFAGRYDAESRRLTYSNAGHLAPILLLNGEVNRLDATGTVLGLFPNLTYEARSTDLQPGTILVLFTDGITEAVNSADEEFGEDRLIAIVRECRDRSAEEIYRQVIIHVRQWQGELKQHDDITLIVAKAA